MDDSVSTLRKCYALPYGIFEPRSLYKSVFLAGLISGHGGRKGGPSGFTKTSHTNLGLLNEATHLLTGTQRGLKAIIQLEFTKYTTEFTTWL